MSEELVRRVAQATREKETRTRENLRKNQHTWAHAISMHMNLTALRMFVPMSSVAYTNPDAIDVSGNGNHLTNNNVATFGSTGFARHATFNGTNQYFSHVDGGVANRFDITGTEAKVDAADRGLTIGSWVQSSSFAAIQGIAEKGNAYLLVFLGAANNQPAFQIRDTTPAFPTVTSSTTVATNTWVHVVGRFNPGVGIYVFVNGVSTFLASATSVAITDSANQFVLGARSTPGNYLSGKESLAFLCAAALEDDDIKGLYEQSRKAFGV